MISPFAKDLSFELIENAAKGDLRKLQAIIQELVSAPVRPNDLTTSMWAERGELVEVDVAALRTQISAFSSAASDTEIVLGGGVGGASTVSSMTDETQREEVAAQTIAAAEELKESTAERAEEQKKLRVELADDDDEL